MRSQMDLFYHQAGRRCAESPGVFKQLILAHREFVGPVFINGVPVETIPDLPFLGGVQRAASTRFRPVLCAIDRLGGGDALPFQGLTMISAARPNKRLKLPARVGY